MLLDSDVYDLHGSTKTVPEKSRTRCVKFESNEKELGEGISLVAWHEFPCMSREEIPPFSDVCSSNSKELLEFFHFHEQTYVYGYN